MGKTAKRIHTEGQKPRGRPENRGAHPIGADGNPSVWVSSKWPRSLSQDAAERPNHQKAEFPKQCLHLGVLTCVVERKWPWVPGSTIVAWPPMASNPTGPGCWDGPADAVGRFRKMVECSSAVENQRGQS